MGYLGGFDDPKYIDSINTAEYIDRKLNDNYCYVLSKREQTLWIIIANKDFKKETCY